MNEDGLDPDDTELSARIAIYELAFRMQSAAPEAVDLSREPESTREMYGLNDPKTAEFGTRCLLARRLVERGVRFVQLYSGGGPVAMQWDAHDDIDANHEKMCGLTDKPVAALLTDLKRTGLLDDTLVIWGAEFGRTPVSQKGGRGRDHNATGFTMWMAGGGVKGGAIVGATDEIGLNAVEDRAHVNDIHATILHLMGLDHKQLTYPAQRPRRAPDRRRRPGDQEPAGVSLAGRLTAAGAARAGRRSSGRSRARGSARRSSPASARAE